MIRVLLIVLILASVSCSPYRGFTGVKTEEISGKKPPSQKIREGHKKAEKKMRRAYKREMKKKAKRLGTTKSR